MRTTPPTESQPRVPIFTNTRAGFTLLEVLLAIILIDVALLALVGGSATLVRRATDLQIRGAALRAATERIQTLSLAPCAASSGSAQGAFGLRESWMVTLPARAIREVTDSVAYATHERAASVVLRTRLAC